LGSELAGTSTIDVSVTMMGEPFGRVEVDWVVKVLLVFEVGGGGGGACCCCWEEVVVHD